MKTNSNNGVPLKPPTPNPLEPELTLPEILIYRLYKARMESFTAKCHRASVACEVGPCERKDRDYTPCYLESKTTDKWCSRCIAKLPAWTDYRKKSVAAGVALRAVLRYGKGLK